MDVLVRSQEGVPAHPVERSQDAFVQVLIGPEDGTVHALVRRFTLLPGGRRSYVVRRTQNARRKTQNA